jgi:hypothetical protein
MEFFEDTSAPGSYGFFGTGMKAPGVESLFLCNSIYDCAPKQGINLQTIL